MLRLGLRQTSMQWEMFRDPKAHGAAATHLVAAWPQVGVVVMLLAAVTEVPVEDGKCLRANNHTTSLTF